MHTTIYLTVRFTLRKETNSLPLYHSIKQYRIIYYLEMHHYNTQQHRSNIWKSPKTQKPHKTIKIVEVTGNKMFYTWNPLLKRWLIFARDALPFSPHLLLSKSLWCLGLVTSTADIISPSTGISINLLSAVGLIIIFELILNIKHYFYCPLCIW